MMELKHHFQCSKLTSLNLDYRNILVYTLDGFLKSLFFKEDLKDLLTCPLFKVWCHLRCHSVLRACIWRWQSHIAWDLLETHPVLQWQLEARLDTLTWLDMFMWANELSYLACRQTSVPWISEFHWAEATFGNYIQ